MNDHWIYLITNASMSHVKIGRTDTQDGIKKRLAGLQTGHHEHLSIIGEIKPGDHPGESELHKQFKEYRAAGEWFRLDGPVTAFALEHTKHAGARRVLERTESRLSQEQLEKRDRIAMFVRILRAIYKTDDDSFTEAICEMLTRGRIAGERMGFTLRSIERIDEAAHAVLLQETRTDHLEDIHDLERAAARDYFARRREWL